MPDMRRPIFLMLLMVNLPLIGQDTIRAQVDVVVVPVSVRDSKGNAVDDLRREDFRIFEDGRPQEIRSASFESAPLSVALMIDTGMADFFLNQFADPFGPLVSALAGEDEAAIY